jgi:hypothetical protein
MKKSKVLVIDADIARAAGKTQHPVSSACRDVLDNILEICHKIVLSPILREEWTKHQSKYTSTWLRTMIAKRKVKFENISEDQQLRTSIAQHAATLEINEIMQKDVHLIETAQVTDKIVISMDNTVREHFKIVSIQVHQLKEINWANPHPEHQESVITWLKDGCEIENRRKLSSSL